MISPIYVVPVTTGSYIREWRYSSTLSYIWHCTQANGQLHALVSLPPGKKPSVPITYKTGCVPKPTCMLRYLVPAEPSSLVIQLIT